MKAKVLLLFVVGFLSFMVLLTILFIAELGIWPLLGAIGAALLAVFCFLQAELAVELSEREVVLVHYDQAEGMLRSGEWKLSRREDHNHTPLHVYLTRVK